MSAELEEAWLNPPDGYLGARREALAWALRKAWYAMGNGKYGLVPFVQEHLDLDVRPQTLHHLFSKIDDDPEQVNF